MPTVNGQDLAPVSYVTTLAQRVKSELDTLDGKNFGGVAVTNGKINFYATSDTSATALASVDLPEEIFLDQTQTSFVQSFAFSSATYPSATNPNLDGKPVLVLAVKGDNTSNPTLSFSFINLESLIDTYSAGNTGINISGYSIGLNISTVTGNLANIDSSGLFVGSDNSKLDTVSGSQGNFLVFGANGTISDSGSTIADSSAINSILDSIFGSSGN